MNSLSGLIPGLFLKLTVDLGGVQKRIGNALELRLLAVRVDLDAVSLIVRHAARAVHAAADACHALDEVSIELSSRSLHQRKLALFNAVAAERLEFKVYPLLLQRLGGSLGKPAAVGKYAPVAGGTRRSRWPCRGT